MIGDEAFWARESAEWMSKRASMTMLLDDTDAVMTKAEFDQLAEYSSTVPTGAPVGKIWKRNARIPGGGPMVWWLGEYWDDGQIKATGSVPIRWRRIHLVDGVAP